MTATIPEAKPILRVADRCDHRQCNAQARVLTTHSGLPLYHCGHHFTRVEHLIEHLITVDNREV